MTVMPSAVFETTRPTCVTLPFLPKNIKSPGFTLLPTASGPEPHVKDTLMRFQPAGWSGDHPASRCFHFTGFS